MPIPPYQNTMLPLLKLLSDGTEHSLRKDLDRLADEFGLSDEERLRSLPSGHQEIFLNRVGWARTYLKKAGLLEYPKRGIMRITERGRKVLEEHPKKLDNTYLRRFDEFVEFQSRKKMPPAGGTEIPAIDETPPEEQLESAYEALRNTLESDILEQIKSNSPAFFERLVVDLLVGMGYGGNRRDAGQSVGKSNDGGIDGIIKELESAKFSHQI